MQSPHQTLNSKTRFFLFLAQKMALANKGIVPLPGGGTSWISCSMYKSVAVV